MTIPRLILAALAATLALSAPASAACFADYKAKRDNPLRLHYGTIQIRGSACTREAAAPQIRARISSDGWVLLNVLSVFDESGLQQRRPNAGRFHLRY